MPEFIEHNLRFIIFMVIIVVALGQKILQVIQSTKETAHHLPQDSSGPAELPRQARPPRQPYTPPPISRTVGPPSGKQEPLPPPPLPGQQQIPEVSSAHNTELESIRQRDLEERLSQIRACPSQTQATAPPPLAPRRRKRTTPSTGGILQHRLRDRREVRRAFVLKELLDQPIALRQ
ncbi:MAG: hypothetical protein K9N23_23000 [Akkermansiaceae bacterium]|nr:hypothetical protein [Akkermansiaceae bacterium]MCF7734570.1 hypothetical protein [Akkermansiaceae bacterium]